MWRPLPQQGARVRAIQIEARGSDRSVVIVDETGERLRVPAPDVYIETSGPIVAQTKPVKGVLLCVTFSARELVLARAEVDFDGTDVEWDKMWRRAQMQSRPWWQDDDTGGVETDLDWPMNVRLKLNAS
jgi:hypothetical protein